MNIFKILASGDGKIFELSISAFLAYLLDPKKDHGLGDSLILKIMNPLVSNSEASKLADLKNSEGYIQYLYPNPRYEIEVFLEQAFVIEGKPKQISKVSFLDVVNDICKKLFFSNYYKYSLYFSINSSSNLSLQFNTVPIVSIINCFVKAYVSMCKVSCK